MPSNFIPTANALVEFAEGYKKKKESHTEYVKNEVCTHYNHCYITHHITTITTTHTITTTAPVAQSAPQSALLPPQLPPPLTLHPSASVSQTKKIINLQRPITQKFFPANGAITNY